MNMKVKYENDLVNLIVKKRTEIKNNKYEKVSVIYNICKEDIILLSFLPIIMACPGVVMLSLSFESIKENLYQIIFGLFLIPFIFILTFLLRLFFDNKFYNHKKEIFIDSKFKNTVLDQETLAIYKKIHGEDNVVLMMKAKFFEEKSKSNPHSSDYSRFDTPDTYFPLTYEDILITDYKKEEIILRKALKYI